ncbi:hypothetical protein DH2020_002159 [Rehmannia glutinosa]|uniref:SKP1-like protein n=2 Tax=Rehmannia glutinosa TaxID=99300 RepID=A0ABR0XSW7_REHGL
MLKAYVWLQTSDGSIQQVEQEVAMYCPFICQEIHSGMGSSKNYPISLPSRVNPPMLSLILDYCRFHQVPGRSNKERKSFDEKFVRMDTKRLCELTSAADSLQLKPLVDLTSRALARVIEGKTPEEIREIFHLPDDLTEEEKLEPIKNTMDDPRIRLLNRLYARKRKELKERERLKTVEVEEERADDRSVDDLLSFINGGNEDSKGSKTSKNKKKNRKRKDPHKTAPSNCTSTSNSTSSSSNVVDMNKKESNELDVCSNPSLQSKLLSNVCDKTKSLDIEDDGLTAEDEFDDCDLDDDIDPALKEKIDRFVGAERAKKETLRERNLMTSMYGALIVMIDLWVKKGNHRDGSDNFMVYGACMASFTGSLLGEGEEWNVPSTLQLKIPENPLVSRSICTVHREVEDFARRLNSDWPERMQEILSLGQERRPLQLTINGNGSLRRFTNSSLTDMLHAYQEYVRDEILHVSTRNMLLIPL